MREKHLNLLNEKIKPFERNNIETTDEIAFGFKAKLKIVLYQIKVLFYKFARFSVVVLVLMFTTQSEGLLSSFYCLFCLFFICRENLIFLHSEKRSKDEGLKEPLLKTDKLESDSLEKITSYTNLLGYLLKLTALDLTLQVIIQFPYDPTTEVQDQFFLSFGLFKL